MTWQPGPASDEEESPAGWVLPGAEPLVANPAWQTASAGGPYAAEPVPPAGGSAPAEPGPAPAAETRPLAIGPEPARADWVPPAGPRSPTGLVPPAAEPPAAEPPAGEPPAADPPRLAAEGPAADVPPLPADPLADLAVAGGDYPQLPSAPHRGRSWAAMVALLAIGLCGLAGGAAGAVRQLLPREFSVAQQRQIENWQMSRRWRAQQAGQIFPASLPYQVSGQWLNGGASLDLTASRLGIARASTCGKAVSKAAAAVLAAGRCTTVLRATYLDASESMVTTVGVAALSTPGAARTAHDRLAASTHNQSFALHAFPLARSAAASFRQAERQYSIAMSAGPYVVLATAGFTDTRRHVPLTTDDYIQQEMSSLVNGLAKDIVADLGQQPTAPTCPGAPGC